MASSLERLERNANMGIDYIYGNTTKYVPPPDERDIARARELGRAKVEDAMMIRKKPT